MAVADMSACQCTEFPTTFNKVLSDSFLLRVILERKCWKQVNRSRALKIVNLELNTSFSENLSIVVHVAAVKLVIFHAVVLGPLFNSVQCNTSWLLSAKAFCI